MSNLHQWKWYCRVWERRGGQQVRIQAGLVTFLYAHTNLFEWFEQDVMATHGQKIHQYSNLTQILTTQEMQGASGSISPNGQHNVVTWGSHPRFQTNCPAFPERRVNLAICGFTSNYCLFHFHIISFIIISLIGTRGSSWLCKTESGNYWFIWLTSINLTLVSSRIWTLLFGIMSYWIICIYIYIYVCVCVCVCVCVYTHIIFSIFIFYFDILNLVYFSPPVK